MSNTKKRKLDTNNDENDPLQKYKRIASDLWTLPIELFDCIMESVTGEDQIRVVALLYMTSTDLRSISLRIRQKYNIPPLITRCNIRISEELDFNLSIPKEIITTEEYFLLKCSAKSIFTNYLDFREWNFLYVLCGWFYHKYQEYVVDSIARVDYSLQTEIMSGGIEMDDPSPRDVEKTYLWCVLRERELLDRGWTWTTKRFNKMASEYVTDAAIEMAKKRENSDEPCLFKVLHSSSVPHSSSSDDEESSLEQ